MKEHPILFSTQMVRAILDGRKTQTRRVIKPQPGRPLIKNAAGHWRGADMEGIDPNSQGWKCPYGQPGDQLWVRETWKPLYQNQNDGEWTIEYKTGEEIQVGRLFPPELEHKEIEISERLAKQYEEKGYMTWRPSIFMPRGASRIQLTVTDIRVERVQDISSKDVLREGLEFKRNGTQGLPPEIAAEDHRFDGLFISPFRNLWNQINAGRNEGQFAWEENPWVWVVEFKVKERKS